MTPLLKNTRKRIEILILIIWKYKRWSWEKALMKIGCTHLGSFSPLKFRNSVLDRQALYSLAKWKDSRALNVKTAGLHLTWVKTSARRPDIIDHTFVKKDRPNRKRVDIFDLSGKNSLNSVLELHTQTMFPSQCTLDPGSLN